jgi:site-specific DNA recombinase
VFPHTVPLFGLCGTCVPVSTLQSGVVSRLSRDKYDLAYAKKCLRDHGVKIVHIAETVPEDDEVTRILIESFYEGVAAAEIFKHRKNVMRGLSYNAERAIYNGIRILGYRGEPDKKYEIDETTTEIVRKIFNEFEMGVSLTDICSGLNKKGLTTIHGNNFTINALRHILQNKAYIGVYKWGDIVVPDGMPRIIDDKTFETV